MRIFFILLTFLTIGNLFAQEKEQILLPQGSFSQDYVGFPILNAKGTFISQSTSVGEQQSGKSIVKVKRLELENAKTVYSSEAGNRSGILMGSWDLNGDGKQQMVFNYGHYIKVLQPGGSAKSYSIGPRWALMRSAICDTDGDAGLELPFNTGGIVKIVKDKNQSMRDYRVHSGSWALMAAIDTDGVIGNEIVFNIGAHIKIINNKTQKSKQYHIRSGSWALLSGGIGDLDGKPGNELAFNTGGGVKVVANSTQKSKEYFVGIPWALVGITEHNEIPGAEILYRRAGLWAISHRKEKAYFITSVQKASTASMAARGDCPKCDGSGKMPVLCPHFKRFVLKCTKGCRTTTCETCMGSGSVPPGHMECPACKARGMIGNCARCGYVLWCSHGANWSICGTCNKHGIVSSENMACPRCRGKGRISYCNPCGKKFLLSCSHGLRWTGCGACDKGLIAHGHSSCPRCRGRGEYIYCSSCKAEVLSCSHNSINNYRICGTCNKTGRISSEHMACPRCKGKGKVSYCNPCGKKFLATCSHGLKWTGCGACEKGLISNGFFPCPRCRGWGEYMYCSTCQKEVLTCSHNSIHHYLKCGTCDKTGRVSNKYKPCPICKGSGKRSGGACIVCSGKGIIENIGGH